MKKLNRMLLIHWYTYDCEVISFDKINFLTGKTAAGKSTIIDALQLVLLGDTNGNFFNKAANEKSVRTLKSYLFGENGDDGQTGFRYLRNGTFTSYVVLEFADTERQTSFLTGIVCDCYEDLHYDYKWFTADRMSLPEHLFIDAKTRTPFTISELKRYLKRESNKRYEIIDTNKRFQEVILAKYGSVKRKYLVLLKKAVPFSPITDIEKFITESICDVKNNIEVAQMQSDIRQYKNLEDDAVRTEARVAALREIADMTRECEADQERYHQQSYIILRAQQEEYRAKEAELKERLETLRETGLRAERELKQTEAELELLEADLASMEEEYHTSDIAKRQKSLEQQISGKKQAIQKTEADIRKVANQLAAYGTAWTKHLDIVRKTGFPVTEEAEQLFAHMQKASEELNACLCDTEKVSKDVFSSGKDFSPVFSFETASGKMEQLRSDLSEYAFSIRQRTGQLKESITDLDGRIDNLKKGIKPWPVQVIALKNRLESELFRRYHKTVEIPVFAELLEIRDPAWQNAVEGYLDRQKFNLLVPASYFADANEIYQAAGKEERLFDTGLVDLGKLRSEYRRKPEKGSLAEEIETDSEDARLYADYLLGNVIKCGDVRELNRYRTAITKKVMLYKGFVSRRLNPARYANPFIGRRSLEILMHRLTDERELQKKEYDRLSNDYRLVKRAASEPVMSDFEAEQHQEAVEQAQSLPELRDALAAVEKEYFALDLTWLNRLQEEIHAKRALRKDRTDRQFRLLEEKTAAEVRRQRMEETDLPQIMDGIRSLEDEIESSFETEWIRTSGEPRFQKELRSGDRTRLTLLESFWRARAQTVTIREGHQKERRRMRVEYNQTYRMPYDTEREDNREYDQELKVLSEIRLPAYIEQIKDAKEKAYNQFRDDFIAKLKSNIESVREQINELNQSLKQSVFGTDRYRFVMSPRAEYRNYYDMITDPLLMDTGGWNIASQAFNEKYQKEIDSLFRALIISDTETSAERRAEYEKSIRKFTDYKTYLVFDLIVTNEQGEEQRLSKTLLKKSGGETQIPFYISLLASFSQVCRIRSRGRNNTIRVIILDEAFSKMDGERIRESIHLLRRFGLQAIFSAPPEKTADIAPSADNNIVVYKSGHHSFTRQFEKLDAEEMDALESEET